ncbi:tyrosine/serine/threonine protein phosphatase pps1 [Yamadazyma tenuis]|uniref:Uncharacterized protein n=1 Tax=Candida tenuis (strain ATCC 10573 / BCRC 21748 / CBS 615 / JCM 9827 / NBRC 10315 / NRRL Y-1498 / VKM Y-70) TaxID=590646 RepID=G3BEC9_CANTC|nr:uncharacterized protein CANTEDRAFT_95963 [Yamadazyma tenuis ATCC 10573]EGV60515.1 hypothetical protein CANTEDRAFT_95963 [Yamadazyma tenuis ATCC 10573]WEJ94245.1 tyrosine/serine/threonine protein phosphatase pps1 [Yamadazyma tenuis]
MSSNLLEKYSNLNLSIESIDSLEGSERRDSATSDITVSDSKDNLSILEKNIDNIITDSCLAAAFDKYSISDAPNNAGIVRTPSGETPVENFMHPFIESFNSKLKCLSDRIYMLNVDNLIDLMTFYYGPQNPLDDGLFPYLHGLKDSRSRIFFNSGFKNSNGDQFAVEDFPHLDVEHFPAISQLHMMFLNTQEECGDFQLNNSVSYEEFVDCSNAYIEDMNNEVCGELNNRNYKNQLHVYSKMCHLVLYNNTNNLNVNLNKALELNTSNNIYIVNFNNRLWNIIPEHFTNESNFESIHQLPINSINNQVFNCQLLKWEQNLLWKFNSMKWFNRNVCIGNLIDYNYLANIDHNFEMIINCNEYCKIPKSIGEYSEFPSSGYLHFEHMNLADIINFLNLLKTIKALHDRNKQVFVFSFDGFTGLTTLTLAIGMMLSDMSLEEVIMDLYSTKNLKFYYFKSDLIFLKKMEKFINYSKRQVGMIKFINYNELETPKVRGDLDWFNYNKDNNFPCNIHKNIYLGSVNHANSKTVLNCMKFNKIVSVGSKPQWLDIDGHKPVFQYKNKQDEIISIYDIKIHDEGLPYLTSALYIDNLKDDGKDEILPLLIEVPDHIQLKYLSNPDQSMKTFYHCQIGVSRSASLVIASLMRFQKLSLIESYMITRINRFNIIIQPNLRIFYDLYLYENYLNSLKGRSRSYTWYHLCNEIFKLNRNYIE